MTGIPPHVAHLCKINTMDIKASVLEFTAELRDSVSHAVDDKVEESGGINASILNSLISELEKVSTSS